MLLQNKLKFTSNKILYNKSDIYYVTEVVSFGELKLS